MPGKPSDLLPVLRQTPLEFRFSDSQYLWWKPRPDEPACRKVILPDLNQVLTELLQVVASGERFERLVIIYPTARHNLFLPAAIALNYLTLETQAKGLDSVVVWTPDREFRESYVNTYIGRFSAEFSINEQFSLSTQVPGENVCFNPGGLKRFKEREPTLFHSSRPGYFAQPFPAHRKTLAVLVDGNHRAVPPLKSTIKNWAKSSGARLLAYVFTNPLHPMIRELARDGYRVLAWSAQESREEKLVKLARSKDPFLRSVLPLVHLSHPDFHYQLEQVVDPKYEEHLTDIAKLVHQYRPRGNDKLGKRLHRYRQSVFRKLATLTVPLEIHSRHYLGRYQSVDIRRQAKEFIDLASKVADKRPDEAEKCRAIAVRVELAVKLLETRPPAKHEALGRLLRESEGSIVLAVDNFSQRDALEEAFNLASDYPHVEVKRIQDLPHMDVCDEVWLLGPPTFFTAYSLRAGLALKTRLLTYHFEEDPAATLLQMAHVPSLSNDHVASRREELAKLLKVDLDETEPAQEPHHVLIRRSDGRTIQAKSSASVVDIGKELQEAADWQSQLADDAKPETADVEGDRRIERRDKVRIILEDGVEEEFHKEHALLRIKNTAGEHEIISAGMVKKGNDLLLGRSDARQAVLERILAELEANPLIGPRVHLVKRWGQQLKRYKEDNELTFTDLYERFKEVELSGKQTSITQPQTIRNWSEGHVVGPGNDDDLRRVAILVDEPILNATVDATIDAIHTMRRLNSKIMRHIMREAIESDWREPVVLDEEYDVHFTDFEGLFKVARVVDTIKGK